MNTAMLLMAQYGMAIVPSERVAVDYFDLTPAKFARKIASGEIKLALVRMSDSRKSAKGVHITDLAAYIDQARADGKLASGT